MPTFDHVDSLLDIVSVAGGIAASVVAAVVLFFNSRTSALKATVDSLVALSQTQDERIERLEANCREMQCENDKLRREQSDLQTKYDNLQALYRKAQDVIAGLQRRVEELEGENRRLRRNRAKTEAT